MAGHTLDGSDDFLVDDALVSGPPGGEWVHAERSPFLRVSVESPLELLGLYLVEFREFYRNLL